MCSTFKYSLSEYDNHEFTMLHRALEMAESLVIVNDTKRLRMKTPHFSEDMRRSPSQLRRNCFSLTRAIVSRFKKSFDWFPAADTNTYEDRCATIDTVWLLLLGCCFQMQLVCICDTHDERQGRYARDVRKLWEL
jgi:hypothetical protein